MNRRKNLLQRFIEFNQQKRLVGIKKITLVAVSGGIDSVVLCHLLHLAQFPFAIAHCNFRLRGVESDEDAQFVKGLAEEYGVTFFLKEFNTEQYAMQNHVSTQVAARELRYNWFSELREDNKFHVIATAHHLNDCIETILYNLVRGTGIRGLRGIPVKQGTIVRPFLFAPREEIEDFAREHKLEYREDSSNKSDKYTRNKIRHKVIPLLKEINPSLEHTFLQKIELFSRLEGMFERQMKSSAAKLFLPRGKDIYIPIRQIQKTKNVSDVMYEYLSDFGFSFSQVEDILSITGAESGKQLLTAQVRIIKDRNFLILTKLKDMDSGYHILNPEANEFDTGDGRRLVIKTLAAADVNLTKERNTAFLDKSKLEYPLILRRWRQGDYFYPFGMNLKKKKLKKFFADEKIPLNEKENVWVLESNRKVVWLAGYRIDERFKINSNTREVLKIQLKQKGA